MIICDSSMRKTQIPKGRFTMAVTALPDLLLVDQYRKMGCSGPLWMWMHDLVMSWFQALRYLMLHARCKHAHRDRHLFVTKDIPDRTQGNSSRIGTVSSRLSITVDTDPFDTPNSRAFYEWSDHWRLLGVVKEWGLRHLWPEGYRRSLPDSLRTEACASNCAAVDDTPTVNIISRVEQGVLPGVLLPKSARKYPLPLSPTSPFPASSS